MNYYFFLLFLNSLLAVNMSIFHTLEKKTQHPRSQGCPWLKWMFPVLYGHGSVRSHSLGLPSLSCLFSIRICLRAPRSFPPCPPGGVTPRELRTAETWHVQAVAWVVIALGWVWRGRAGGSWAGWSPHLVWGGKGAGLGVLSVLPSAPSSGRWLSWPRPFISYKYPEMECFVVKVGVDI